MSAIKDSRVWLLVVGLVVLSPLMAAAQEQSKVDPQQLDPAAMQKLWEDFAKLAPQHELFKQMAGQWQTEMKSFYPNPAEPSVTQGSATFKLLMDGRYLVQQYKGTYDGKEFEGLGISAYDKTKNKYTAVWIDNMSTAIMPTEGTYDPATKTMTEIGESDSPLGKITTRSLTNHVSPDKFVFTMYMTMPGMPEMKSMEITYTRQ